MSIEYHSSNERGDIYHDVRWQCRCGRFIAASAIRSEVRLEPNAYYGIMEVEEYDCGRCGAVAGLPRCTVVGTFLVPDTWPLDQPS